MSKLKPYRTHNTALIEHALYDAMTNKKLVGIVGYPGAGKSRNIEIIQSTRKNIFSIQLGKSVTPKAMYLKLLNSISQTPKLRKYFIVHEISELIVEELIEIPGHKVLVIDEAGFFDKSKVGSLLEVYNLIYDQC